MDDASRMTFTWNQFPDTELSAIYNENVNDWEGENDFTGTPTILHSGKDVITSTLLCEEHMNGSEHKDWLDL